MKRLEIFRSEQFRSPWWAERALGLWVDRIGEAEQARPEKPRLRILGLYAAVCCESGEGVYRLDGVGEIEVKAGDVMLAFPDVPAVYYPLTRWRTFWFVWGGPEAGVFEKLGLLSKTCPVIRRGETVARRAYAALKPLMCREDVASALERKNILSGALLEFHRRDWETKTLSPTERSVAKALSVIETAVDRDLRVAELAGALAVSPTHFRRLFKTVTGRSPLEYVVAARVAKAKERLAAGLSVKETAAAGGFQNAFYFTRVFKKVTGVTPGEFRRR